ncbi:MAG: rhomboid family intramembrane serine protease [Planctomycetales bacterium]|nr:rhomboid family intramembrane serine protease [Planctomycetales bacterium]
MNLNQCPHCGEALPRRVDAFCPFCRESLSEAFDRSPVASSRSGIDGDGTSRSVNIVNVPQSDEPDEGFETIAKAIATSLINIVIVGLLAAVFLSQVGSSPGNFIFVIMMVAGAIAMLMDWRTPPRLEASSTQLRFSNSLLRWRTGLHNLASIKIHGGKLHFWFGEDEVTVEKGKLPEAASRKTQSGSDFSIPATLFPADGLIRLVERCDCGTPEFIDECEHRIRFHNRLSSIISSANVTIAIVVLNVAIFLAILLSGGFSPANMIDWGANFQPLVATGQWWRLVTAVFLHFSVMHLLLNCWVLWDIGKLVERILGHWRFGLAYFVSGFAGSIASVTFTAERSISAGASGAVFGVFGTLLGITLVRPRMLPVVELSKHRNLVVAFFVINLFIALTNPWIDLAAHVGGFVAGIACGLLLTRDIYVERPRLPWLQPLLVSLVFVATSYYAITQWLTIDSRVMEIAAQVDKAIRATEEKVFSGEASDETPEAMASFIRQTGVEPLTKAASQLDAITLLPPKSEEYRNRIRKFAEAFAEGYVHLAIYFERDEILEFGKYAEKLEQVMGYFPDQELPKGFLNEFGLCVLAEDRILEELDSILIDLERSSISHETFNELLEEKIIRSWQDALNRFSQNAPSAVGYDRELVEHWEKYMELKLEGWRILKQAMTSDSQELFQQSEQLSQDAIAHRDSVFSVEPTDGVAQ